MTSTKQTKQTSPPPLPSHIADALRRAIAATDDLSSAIDGAADNAATPVAVTTYLHEQAVRIRQDIGIHIVRIEVAIREMMREKGFLIDRYEVAYVTKDQYVMHGGTRYYRTPAPNARYNKTRRIGRCASNANGGSLPDRVIQGIEQAIAAGLIPVRG